MSVTTYDPQSASLTLGPSLISGFAEDSMIEIEYASKKYEKKVGVDGQTTRIRQHDRSGTLKISLMSTSVSNRVLGDLAKGALGSVIDTLLSIVGLGQSSLNSDVHAVMLYDASTGMKFSAPDCWVAKEPSIKKSKDVDTIEWELEFANGETKWS